LYYLHQLGQLELLPQLFGQIWVPESVRDELAQGAKLGCPVPDVGQHSWVELKAVEVPSDLMGLGRGEREVIALGMKFPGSRLILDDLEARLVAESKGFQPIGTLGLFLAAKKHGHLQQITPLLDQLVQHGFWLNDNLRASVLKAAKE